MLKRLSIIGLILLLSAIGFAQETTPEPEITPDAEATSVVSNNSDEMCPALVSNALDLTQRNCSATGSNEACYGYIFIDAALRAQNEQFSQPGDILDVINIESLQLSPLDTNSGQWGVIVMSVEANLTDRTQAVNDDVQIVLFGDTALRDASQFIEVSAISTVNIRRNPRTNAEVIGSLSTDDTIIANGRLDDSSWLRVRVNDDGVLGLGWISADFLEPSADIALLPPLTTEEAENPADDLAIQYGPMQAFVFESAEADAPCEQAPNSGMLIQTPDGAASVTLWLDEVVIQLDGTGIISAQANGDLTVGVIDGTAQVEANGGISTAVAGQAIDVPLDGDLVPADEPSDPRPIDANEVQALPVDLLNDPVSIPLVNDNNNSASNILASADGNFQWRFNYASAAPYICSDGSEVVLDSAGIAPTISAEADAIVVSGLRFAEVTEGVYRASYVDNSNNLIQDTLQVIASDRIIGDRTIDFSQPICTLNVSFTIHLGTP